MDNYKTIRRINLPTEEDSPSVQSVQPSLKRTFANAHSYHVNSLALNSDGETFISADDLRINVWRLESNQTTFSEMSFGFYFTTLILCFRQIW